MKIQSTEITFTKSFVEELRQGMIELRDEALKQNMFEWAITISQVIMFMALVKEQIDD